MQQAECTRNCWITGAIAGLAVMLFVSGIGETDWLGGIFLGALTCVLLGGLLVLLVAQGQPRPYDHGLRPSRPAPAMAAQAGVTVAKAVVSPDAATTDAPETDTTPQPEAEPAAPRVEKAEKQDLKRINGIGPKIEELLNDLGITRFEQIAGWGAEDEQKIAASLGRFGGRIASDNWIAQARDLMASDEITAGGRQ
ncbi:hypothetical protein PE067_15180 [Paracoccus sp. DMF-8]|uniref:hypothetical protein n=1 Tax=Paracoccus sp. DMF-8 TaxID=3019445 RepID=UPI0023E45E56|nr:hypothetical protein [Paracoccus sp. DMF-8]MDF3607358.1 hypothetical protein [Paracoccus sp. DMF-8]